MFGSEKLKFQVFPTRAEQFTHSEHHQRMLFQVKIKPKKLIVDGVYKKCNQNMLKYFPAKIAILLCNGVFALGCFEINIGYIATDINNGLYQMEESANDCQNVCKERQECEGFDWATPNFPGD
jgi:hypothetical protein